MGGGVTTAVGNDVGVSGATTTTAAGGSSSTSGSTSGSTFGSTSSSTATATTTARSFARSPTTRTAAVTGGRCRRGRLVIIAVSMTFAGRISTSTTGTATVAA